MNTSKLLTIEDVPGAQNKILDNIQITLLPKGRWCPGPCWVWQKCTNKMGYGQCCGITPKRSQLAHRVSFAVFNGPLLEGMEIDHICENKRCVNPEHLEQKTLVQHAQVKSLQNKTHCNRGHLLSEVGYYSKLRSNGKGVNNTCAACHKLTRARHEEKKKLKQLEEQAFTKSHRRCKPEIEWPQ